MLKIYIVSTDICPKCTFKSRLIDDQIPQAYLWPNTFCKASVSYTQHIPQESQVLRKPTNSQILDDLILTLTSQSSICFQDIPIKFQNILCVGWEVLPKSMHVWFCIFFSISSVHHISSSNKTWQSSQQHPWSKDLDMYHLESQLFYAIRVFIFQWQKIGEQHSQSDLLWYITTSSTISPLIHPFKPIISTAL